MPGHEHRLQVTPCTPHFTSTWLNRSSMPALFPTGADPGQDPTPKGGGGPPPPLQTPKWLYRTMGFVGASFRHTAGGNFFVRPYVSILKILRILWRIQKWRKSTKKDFDPDPASGSDLG